MLTRTHFDFDRQRFMAPGDDPEAGYASFLRWQMREADVVVFVVDATVGATDSDEAVIRVLRKAKKPVVLVANKVDDARAESDAAELWSLGLGEPHSVSALHGRGSGDLLDVILEALPETPADRDDEEGGPRRVALLGRPNVGLQSSDYCRSRVLDGEYAVCAGEVDGSGDLHRAPV